MIQQPHRIIFSIIIVLPLFSNLAISANAQIRVDSSSKTKKVLKGNKTEISGGIETKKILLHKFTEFNISENKSVHFLNPNSKNTIVAKVVGSKISNINGEIILKEKANLIFMNPNGINFLKESSLNINGSFLASTADALKQDYDKLTLNFSNNKASIYVEGNGHNLIFSGDSRIPNFFNAPQSIGLSVASNNSLSFVSGNLNFNAGVATSPSGTINLIALRTGKVGLLSTSSGIKISPEITEFGNIKLQNRAFINASGSKKGSIYVQAKDLNISDAALIYAESLGRNNLGVIDIQVSNLKIDGITEKTPLFPFTFDAYSRGISSVSNKGRGPKIQISSDTLTLLNQGAITSNTEGISDGADININVRSQTVLEGKTPFNPFLPFGSFIGSVSRGNGKAGNINLKANDLILKDGANLQSVVLNNGDGGDVRVDISNNLVLSGFSPVSNIPSVISTISVGNLTDEKSGDGGKLKIKSRNLLLEKGGRIDASTLADGNSGSVDIESNTIVIKGGIPNDESSQIISSSNTVNQFLKTGFGLNLPTGDSGSVVIKTNSLNLQDTGSVNVRSDGTGDAGFISVLANEILISNKGNISASTNGGDGGNIVLGADRLSLLNSSISSSARNAGLGGNIQITSTLATLRQQSIVEANAQNNRAGNISWTTNTLLADPSSQVIATSARGASFDGRIETDIQNTQLIKTVKLAPISQVNTDISQICGFDGNRLSASSESEFQNTASTSEFIAAWNVQQRYLKSKGKFFRDIKTGEIKPMRPVLALEYMDDGEIRSIYEPNESEYVSNLLSSLERKCNELRST